MKKYEDTFYWVFVVYCIVRRGGRTILIDLLYDVTL